MCEGFWALLLWTYAQERPSEGSCCYSFYLHKMTNNKSIPTPDVISVKYYIIGHSCTPVLYRFFSSARVFVIDDEFYCFKVTSGNLPFIWHNYQKIQHDWVDLSFIWQWALSTNGHTFLCVDIWSNSTTPRTVALARMFKEAGLRSPRIQLTKVQIEISVQGRRTEAILFVVWPCGRC